MNNTIGALFLLLFMTSSCSSQKQGDHSSRSNKMVYMGQKDPGAVPAIFAPNIISKQDRSEFGSVFSKNGQEVFIGVDGDDGAEILYSKLIDGVWSELTSLLPSYKYSYNDPMLSPDEQRLYFISNEPASGDVRQENHDIWYVERQGDSWSTSINAGPEINTLSNEYYMSFSNDGAMYFSSNKEAHAEEQYNFDIYASQFVNGSFQTALKLDENVNTSRYEADVFVAPDESYIIFCGKRRGGLGRGDLYISFRDNNGQWTPSKNMGSVINTKGHELCPFVSADGKYFFLYEQPRHLLGEYECF